MGKFKLAFGIHNHQPVGNFDSVFQQAHKDSYAPFLQLLEKYPQIRISLHQSGILWSWQQKNQPDYFDLVRKMIDRGQIELLSGGFYEPILTAIPTRDVLGQIDMLTQYLKFQFGADAVGLWLTERVWEPHLPKILNEAGIKFLPVDDTHFVFAGLQHAQLTGPFVTEHEGATVTLLPIQKRLRYLIPFGTVAEVIAELRAQAERNPNGMAVYADDGEKFGVWPNTFKHCFEDRWLATFFDELQRNSDWLEVVPLGTAAEQPAVGRVYLPSASYEEMLHWALPARAFVEYEQFEEYLKAQGVFQQWGHFVRGSHWRAFLAKYDESNLMHKKMLSISNKLEELERARLTSNDQISLIRDKLYASQCNCPYWHGVFGGLYLPHIRQAVFGNMVEADNLIRMAVGKKGVQLSAADYDGDGHMDVMVSSDQLSAVFRPAVGGSLIDLSVLKHGFDLSDTLTRRREGYHLKLDRAVTSAGGNSTASIHDLVLAKEPGLKDFLVEDWYSKRSFIDHFFSAGATLEGFKKGEFGEDGDFVLEPYRYGLDPATNSVLLVRDGHVRRSEGSAAVRIAKRFTFYPDAGRMDVTYELTKLSGHDLPALFAVENNFNFQAGHAHDRFIMVDGHRPSESFLDSTGEHQSAFAVTMSDQYRNLAVGVASDESATIWHSPLFTVSLSEGGFEKVYQGTTLVHLFRLELTDDPVRLSFRVLAGPMAEVQKGILERKLSGVRG